MSLEDCKPSSQANPPSISDIQDQIRSTCEDIIHFCSQETKATFYQAEQSLPHSPGFRGRRNASKGEGRARLDFPLILAVGSSDQLQNNANNIKGLAFYHKIRWNLENLLAFRDGSIYGCNVESALHRVSDRAGKETRAVRLWPQETRGVGCACGWGWRRSPYGVAGPPCLAGVSPGGAVVAGADRRGDHAPASGPGRA